MLLRAYTSIKKNMSNGIWDIIDILEHSEQQEVCKNKIIDTPETWNADYGL